VSSEAGTFASRIESLWRAARRQPLRQGTWLAGSRLSGAPVVFSILACVFLLGFDLALWQPDVVATAPAPTPRAPSALVDLLVLGLAVGCGLVIDRYLSLTTEMEVAYPVWLRRLRFLVSCLPVVGLGALPLWRRVTAHRPFWAGKPRSVPLEVQAAAGGDGLLNRLARGLASDRGLVGWITWNLLLLFLSMPRLGSVHGWPRPDLPARRTSCGLLCSTSLPSSAPFLMCWQRPEARELRVIASSPLGPRWASC
jgi:hypothetical protein